MHVHQSLMSVLRGCCRESTNQKVNVWDFGANIGFYTLFMRAMGCHVTAVEPQPSMNSIHKDSLEANGWNNDDSVVLHEKAVSDMSGSIELVKLWQPGRKDAGKMTIDIITIASLAEKEPVVEILKFDVDGPEIYSLRGIINLTEEKKLMVKNIMAELTVGVWNEVFHIKDNEVSAIFSKFYRNGYQMILVMESEFSKYPRQILSQLQEIKNFREYSHGYLIPEEKIIEVLLMSNRVTKNIFMTRDEELIQDLHRSVVNIN
jgi:FkbM family methyltransferase